MEGEDKARIRKECIKILRAVGCKKAVVMHCMVVAELALELAINHNRTEGSNRVDEELVFRGALLHDLGRARTNTVSHGFIGGEMARGLGLPENVVGIIQRHVGAGITAAEAKTLGLPAMDFIPETMEEKIVADADNLIDGVRRRSIEEAIADLKVKLGATHPSLNRMRALHAEVMR
ncbi:MAG: HDIG domain-containing metalloprotein [Halobacteriota archaeon]